MMFGVYVKNAAGVELAANWSGEKDPPAIGDKVKVNMNGMGFGEVVDYFSANGVDAMYLGVKVKLDADPPPIGDGVFVVSLVEEDDDNVVEVFGAEIKY